MPEFELEKYSKKELFGFWFWVHSLLEIIFLGSFVLFPWWFVVILVVLLFLQFWMFGNCVINKMQFKKDQDSVFLYPYLKMLGWPIGYYKSKIFLRYGVPLIVIGVAIVWQVLLGYKALLF